MVRYKATKKTQKHKQQHKKKKKISKTKKQQKNNKKKNKQTKQKKKNVPVQMVRSTSLDYAWGKCQMASGKATGGVQR